MKLGIIVQARMDSSRLPGKVLKQANGISPLQLIIDKMKYFNLNKNLIIATTHKKIDNQIVNLSKLNRVNFFRGAENNVLLRYYNCAKKFKIKTIVRITADCPFIDIYLLKKMIKIFIKKKLDYISNTYPLPCSYPDGSDIEIFNFKLLKKVKSIAKLPSQKEHVTNLMYGGTTKKIKKIDLKKDYSSFRYTIDNADDFKIFKEYIKKNTYNFILKSKVENLVKYLKKNPQLTKYQKKIKRNYGWQSAYLKDKKYLKINN